jgi:hypothetical protein
VSSAKSWLCHPGVDRTAPLLPWAAPPDVPRLSPLDVSARYLKHFVDAWNHAPGRKPEDRLEDQPVVVTVPASFDDVARNLTAEAAKQAGLKHVTLLEEPQAAFYAWLGTHPPLEATRLKPGMRCVVVDVGGGTSDFSLIRSAEGKGELEFVRDAVGDHLLLGGDNMDLALAKSIEAKLSARPDGAQFGALVQACRSAKEILLADNPPASVPVTVVGRGRSVVAGTVSAEVALSDVDAAVFDGFFPHVRYDADPVRAKAGLQEMGLPYVSDPAVTKHLAAFLRKHVPVGEVPDAILFNGGVFQPGRLRDRLVQVMAEWYDPAWKPLLLTSPSLDLAVAWGAAYFCWLKHTGGKRIGGGIPRSYYVGLQTGPGIGERESTSGEQESRGSSIPDPRSPNQTVLCVVPRRMQEGDEVSIPKPELELALGEPVLFPLFTSSVRGQDKPGDVIGVAPDQLLRLPPLHTVLRGGKRAGTKRVPVTLAAKCTEIGTLELYCVGKEGNRWRLEFNVRDVLQEADEDEAIGPTGVVDVFPEERVRAAADVILSCYTWAESTAPADHVTPKDLVKTLESNLEAGRGDWPTGLCRRMSEFLQDVAEYRGRSPAHLARWYNLTGFCLRPGFGDTLDRYRVEAVWKLIAAGASQSAARPIPEGGADYWILWRRLAGGLNTAQQQQLFSKLRPVMLPAKGKQLPKPHANEYAEMWRAVAALERLDGKTKQSLAEILLRQVKRPPIPTYAYWALTRLGARVPLYGPLNTVVHQDVVEDWVAQLLAAPPDSTGDRLGWSFALAQMARQSGIYSIDLRENLRHQVVTALRAVKVPDAWPRMVEEIVRPEGADQSQLFGESLPIGLRLAK